MKSWNNIYKLIIIGLAIYILFMQMCSPKSETASFIKKVKTPTKTITAKKIKKVGNETFTKKELKPIIKWKTITLPGQTVTDTIIDTVYFDIPAHRYIATFDDDTLKAKISILTDGKILEKPILTYSIEFPVLVTQKIEGPKRKLLIGFELGGGVYRFAFAPDLSFIDKKGNQFGGNFDFINHEARIRISKVLRNPFRRK